MRLEALDTVSEEELVVIIQQQEEMAADDAFGELVRRFRDKVFGLCYSYLHNRSQAEDVVQEIFIRAYRGLAKFESRCKFGTWLFRIATNACLNRIRDSKRRPGTLPVEEAILADPRDDFVDPSAGKLHDELTQALDRAVAALPDRQQETFKLRYYGKLSVRDTAEVMGVEQGTVKAHYFAALRSIGKMLEQELGKEKIFYLLSEA
jgi:RNA polymerase sigma-70 factor (ECF subfamily)